MGDNKILSQIVVLFLIMLVGFYARKRNIINSDINKGLTNLLLDITLPFMIIASFNFKFSAKMLEKSGILLIYGIGIYITFYFVGRLLFRKYPQNIKSVLMFAAMFSNCGFMGYPIIESIYGKEGVFYTAIFNIPFNILIWTLGIAIFAGRKDSSTLKKAFLNPGTISVYIGLLLFLFSIKLPGPVYNTLDMVGSIATPLSMIVIGAMLGEMNIKDVFNRLPVYYGSFIRLIFAPLAVLLVLKTIGASGMNLGIPVMIAAMPVAANTAIIADKYGADSGFASKCIFISTVFSTFTIPLILLLIK